MANPHHVHARTSVRVRIPPTVPKTHIDKSTLKDKLCIYFQSKSVSNSCEVDYIRIFYQGSNGLWARVNFKEPSGKFWYIYSGS